MKDQRFVLVYLALSLAFGVLMGLVFPVYAAFFVEFKSPGHQLVFIAGCIVAGVVVGLASFAIGRVTILRVVRTISERFRELAESDGDLSRDIELRSSDELGHLVDNFNRFQGKLRQMVRQLTDLADQVQQASSILGAATEQSASAIEQMAATTAHVARAAEGQRGRTSESGRELASLVERVEGSNELTQGMATQFFLFTQSMEANRRRNLSTAEGALSASRLAEGLDETSEAGERTLQALRQAIGSVVSQAQAIQEIVKFILDISERTNLLSMNAAIEAAHAGASGRGFAVVAQEIRSLAETSSKQAQNIQSLVDSITASAGQTLTRSEATAESFRLVRSDVVSVKSAAQSIAESMVQQGVEDEKLSEGLGKFTQFYSELAASMDVQLAQTQGARTVLQELEGTSQEIHQSMAEQKVGTEQAAEGVVQVRDTALQLVAVVDGLSAEIRKFRIDAGHTSGASSIK